MKLKTIMLCIIGSITIFACTTQKKVEKFADRKPKKYDYVTLNHYSIVKHAPSFKKIVDSLYPYRTIKTDTTYIYDSVAVASQVFAFIKLADSAYQEFISQYFVPKDSLLFVRDSTVSVVSSLAKSLISKSNPCTTIQRVTVTVKDSLSIMVLEEKLRYVDSVAVGQNNILINKLETIEKDRDKFKERSRNFMWALIACIAIFILVAGFFIYRALKSVRPSIVKTS
jgi:hypothetical protein